MGIICHDVPICVEPRYALGVRHTSRGISRRPERWAGLPDIDPPNFLSLTLQTDPVVCGTIGDRGNLQLSVLRSRLRHPTPHLLVDPGTSDGFSRFQKTVKCSV